MFEIVDKRIEQDVDGGIQAYTEKCVEYFMKKVQEVRESLADELVGKGLTGDDVIICDNLWEVIESAKVVEENGKSYLKHCTEYKCWVERKETKENVNGA